MIYSIEKYDIFVITSHAVNKLSDRTSHASPVIADDFEQKIESICRKYGISYLGSGGNGNGRSTTQLPIEDLFKSDTKIYEGHNRHEALLRAMESLICRNKAILPSESIKELAKQWSDDHCVPPL